MWKVFVVMLGVLCCSLCLEAGIPTEDFERAKFMIKSKQTKQGVELLKQIADNDKTPSAIRAKAILELSVALKSERKTSEAKKYLIKFMKLYPAKNEELKKVCERMGFDHMNLTAVTSHVSVVPSKPFIAPAKFSKMKGLKNKLDNITIDHMEFEDVSISAVVNLLRARSKKLDSEKKGVNIVLLLDPKDSGKNLRTLTIMFDDLSLYEAISNICIAADMIYRVEEYAVVIAAKSVAFDNFETRIYPVEQDAFSTIGAKEPEEGKITPVQDYFARRGVSFPGQAKIAYDNYILIATNTCENLGRIEAIIEELNVIDPQIVIEAKYIKIAKKDFDEIEKTYSISGQTDSLWRKVLSSDKSQTIASASVMTQNGEEATIRMIKEVSFPQAWSDGGPGIEPAKTTEVEKKEKQQVIEKSKSFWPSNGRLIESQSVPEFGEPTELGIRLVVMPVVDPDRYTIALDAVPLFQQHIGWNTGSENVKMPIIKAWTADTQTTVYDGETMLVSSFLEDVMSEKSKTREKNNFMLFYTARLVNPDGSPIRGFDEEVEALPTPSRMNKKENVEAKSSKSVLPDKLNTIMIKNVNFKDVSIETVVHFLQEESKRFDSTGTGINIVLGVEETELANIPVVTMNLKNLPLGEVIRYLCQSYGLKYRVDGQVLTIGTDAIGSMDTRFFSVRNALITRIALVADDKSAAARRAITTKALKAYFIERGVPFPEGSTIAYDSRAGKLVARNTHENLRRLGTLLRALDLEQPQVLTKCSFISISDKDLILLLGKKALTRDVFTSSQIKAIIDSDKGRVIFSQQISSKSGEEARSRSVSETYFPESWTETDAEIKEGCIIPILSNPGYGEATDLGSILIVTPIVSPNNYTITLSLNPQRLKFMAWSEYVSGYSIDGKKVKGTIRMPKILRQDFSANIKIYDGATLCVGRMRYRAFPELENRSFSPSTSWTKMLEIAKGEGRELKNVFFFITARIVNPDGMYIRE